MSKRDIDEEIAPMPSGEPREPAVSRVQGGIGDRETAMLGLWRTGGGPMGLWLHSAFKVSLEDVLGSAARLKAHGVQPLGFSGEPLETPVVLGWMPAVAQYFADPDGHSIEFLHILDERGDSDFGVQPYSRWLARPKP